MLLNAKLSHALFNLGTVHKQNVYVLGLWGIKMGLSLGNAVNLFTRNVNLDWLVSLLVTVCKMNPPSLPYVFWYVDAGQSSDKFHFFFYLWTKIIGIFSILPKMQVKKN